MAAIGGDEWPGIQPAERTVVVIVDVVESVRLMLADEAGFIARWRGFVQAVRSQVLPVHGGRLVKSLGDGLLMVFPDVVSGVTAALALPACMVPFNLRVPDDAALRLRVAVHQADVVMDDIDIYGAGVNLAARLAALAGPDEVVVSAAVRDHLADGHHGHLVDLGECFLKHYATTVRAFRIVPDGQRHSLGIPAAAFFDDRPSLAVVPFSPLGADETPSALGDAIAETVVGALSRSAGLRVVSLLSTLPFRHRPDLAQIGSTLSVAYVLTGSYRLRDGRVRVDAQLCTCRDGRVLWADSLSAELGAIFEGGDDALQAIAEQVGRAVVRAEVQRARSLPIANLEGYTLFIAGVFMLHRLSPTDFAQARTLLEHLCQRHPRSAAPWAMLAKWHLLSSVQGWAADKRAAARESQHCAQRALALESEHALALSMEAIVVAQIEGDLPRALRLGEAAVAADPQESHAWLNLGGIHSYLGHAHESEWMPQRAIELSPMDPARFVFNAFLAEGKLTARKWDEAAQAARASIRLNAMHATPRRILVIALAMAGDLPAARDAAQALLRVDPAFSVSAFQRRYAGGGQPPFLSERLQALQAAGVPA